MKKFCKIYFKVKFNKNKKRGISVSLTLEKNSKANKT